MKFPQRLLRHLDPGAGREDGRTVGRCHRRLRDHQAHREAWNGRRRPGERLREGDGGRGARGVGEEPAGDIPPAFQVAVQRYCPPSHALT